MSLGVVIICKCILSWEPQHHYNKTVNQQNGGTAHGIRGVADLVKGVNAASREARSNQRRLLTAFGTATDSDLLKFNQLKVGDQFLLSEEVFLLPPPSPKSFDFNFTFFPRSSVRNSSSSQSLTFTIGACLQWSP